VIFPVPAGSTDTTPVDINNAAEEQIATLPSIGFIVAKRIVNVRQERGGFRSVEDLANSVNLSPHVVERIRPLVSISPSHRPKGPDFPGRVADF
jgi:DNA uptake protein ComE-like DNA-binding protein